MMTDWFKRRGALVLLLLAAGCAPTAVAEPQRPVIAAPPRATTILGLEGVLGRTAAALTSQFGKADLDVREGTARKLQFSGPACVLDAYLYPRAGGGEPVVTHIDARQPDGRDMDRASCVAALIQQQRVR
jgi:hypothetical protein